MHYVTLSNFKTPYLNFPTAKIFAAQYGDGSPALTIFDPDIGDEHRLTTNVEYADPGCVVVANYYSVKEGLAQEMERHDLGTIEREVSNGFGTCYQFRLSEWFKEALFI